TFPQRLILRSSIESTLAPTVCGSPPPRSNRGTGRAISSVGRSWRSRIFPLARSARSCPRSCASEPCSRTSGSSCSGPTRRASSVLGSHDPRREFLIRSCGILIHGQSVLAQEAVDDRGGKVYALPGGRSEEHTS